MNLVAPLRILFVILSLLILQVDPFLFKAKTKSDSNQVVTVATYNIWNVMFNWEVRKERIIEMVNKHKIDVIALQEVRAHADGSGNQLRELQVMLPQHRFSVFKAANIVTPPGSSDVPQGYELEGLGIISRYRVVAVRQQNLSRADGPDRNRRIALHVALEVGAKTLLVSAVHFSYDRQQQCSNALEVFKFVKDEARFNSIILGDFNTYSNFDWPIKVFTDESLSANLCVERRRLPSLSLKPTFYDAWEGAHRSKGYTFSNMPTPGYESRPDRILSLNTLNLEGSSLAGDGKVYSRRYRGRVFWNRLATVVETALSTWRGGDHVTSRCRHDCGPRAVCRCGVCVDASVADAACEAPDCAECGASLIPLGVTLLLALCVVGVNLAGGVFRLVMAAVHSRLRRRQDLHQMGCMCCLCHPVLHDRVTSQWQASLRRTFIARSCPLFFKTPRTQVIASGVLMLLLWMFYVHVLADTRRTVYGALPEEFFPSDHLMLIASFVL